MKNPIVILVLVIAGAAGVYFFPGIIRPNEKKTEQSILDSQNYDSAANEIAEKINDLSPTPPTGEEWIVNEVEFVKGEPYAYVTYHDTHNIFRILVETGSFRTVGTFEADGSGWKLTHGTDLATWKETVKIDPNQ